MQIQPQCAGWMKRGTKSSVLSESEQTPNASLRSITYFTVLWPPRGWKSKSTKSDCVHDAAQRLDVKTITDLLAAFHTRQTDLNGSSRRGSFISHCALVSAWQNDTTESAVLFRSLTFLWKQLYNITPCLSDEMENSAKSDKSSIWCVK